MGIALSIEQISHSGGIADMARKGKNQPHYMMAAPSMIGTWDIETACGRTLGKSSDDAIEMGPALSGTLCKRCERIYSAMLDAQESAPVSGTDTRETESTPVAEPTETERDALIKAERERRGGVCMGTGLPPVPGTRVQRDDHSVSLPDNYNGKHSAKCPGVGCGRIIAVSREGVMRRHNAPAVRDNSAPTLPGTETLGTTGLTESQMREAVAAYYAAGHSVPEEVATLPDPTPTAERVQWSGTDAGDAGAVVACDFKGDVEIINPEKTHGKCPECRAYLPLLDVKSDPDAQRIGKHNRYGLATPPRPKILLSSESVDTVEHGNIPGDPATADKRRAEESRCKRSGKILAGANGGTVDCPDCARPVELIQKISQTKKGTKVKWQVPEHVDSRDTFRRSGKGERKVTPRGTGADAGKGQRDHGSVDGAATTGRQDMPPVRPGGWVGKAGTMSLPATVRPGIDPKVSGKWCPVCQELVEIAHKDKSKTWRRRHAYKVGAVMRHMDEQRATRKAAEIEKGLAIPSAERRKLRKEASVGSFAEGVNAHTGTVTHEPRPVKAKPQRVTPRGATRKTSK